MSIEYFYFSESTQNLEFAVELDSSLLEDEEIEYRQKIFKPFESFEEYYKQLTENSKSSVEEFYIEKMQFTEKHLTSKRFCGYCLIKKVI